MKRDDMLKKLKTLNFCAIPTVMTMDMGIQFDFVSKDGAGTSFGGIGRWPVYRFFPKDSNVWLESLEKWKSGDILEADLVDTELQTFVRLIGGYYAKGSLGIKEILGDVRRILSGEVSNFFVLEEGEELEIFNDADEVVEIFREYYCQDFDEIAWTDMDDEELEDWYQRVVDGDFAEFPIGTYEDL